MKNNFINIINRFKGKKIGVMGDLMLDQFIFGDVERISPEAPVPVVVSKKEVYKLGGAANTANNICALGGNVFLIGSVGNDNEGKIFLREVKKNSINTNGVFTLNDRSTTQKTRIVAKGQQIVRVDREATNYINKTTEESVIKFISDNFKNWDGVIVSDYGKGFITEKIAKEIITLAKKHKKLVIGDIKPAAHARYFKNIGLLTPNTNEAFGLSQCNDIKEAGKKIQEELNCSVLITRGSDGMTLFENPSSLHSSGQVKITHFPALAKEVVDIVGAGDTVASAFCLSLASGASMEESAVVSSHAASIVVNKTGTATVSLKELKDSFLDYEKQKNKK